MSEKLRRVERNPECPLASVTFFEPGGDEPLATIPLADCRQNPDGGFFLILDDGAEIPVFFDKNGEWWAGLGPDRVRISVNSNDPEIGRQQEYGSEARGSLGGTVIPGAWCGVGADAPRLAA